MITQHEALEYEVGASWWASWMPCFHGLIAMYFAWKVTRKWARYQYMHAGREEYRQQHGHDPR